MSEKKEAKKYEILRDELLNYIKEHNLKQNDKLPTIREIIKDSNFSYATVNRTLIEMENKGIITKHQGKGLYVNRVPNSADVKNIALIIPAHFSDHKIFMNILAGVRAVLEKANIGLLVSISNMSHQKEKETIDMLISKHIDGIIIFMEDHYRKDYSHIAELMEKKFPFVLIDRHVPELETDYVVVNNRDAMFKICSYLKYNRNCDKILFVPDSESPEAISSSQEKVKGFLDAIKVLYGDSEGKDNVILFDNLVQNIDELSKKYKKLGISVNHDAIITELEKRLKELNKELPVNCYLFGYNNSNDLPRYPTVEQFNDQVGRKAAEILIDKLNNPEKGIVQFKVEPKLVFPDGMGGYVMEN